LRIWDGTIKSQLEKNNTFEALTKAIKQIAVRNEQYIAKNPAIKALEDEMYQKTGYRFFVMPEGYETIYPELGKVLPSFKGVTAKPVETKIPKAKEAKPKVETQTFYQFYSPNIEQDLTFERVYKNLTSEPQASLRKFAQEFDERTGASIIRIGDAIGDWVDGAENTVYKEY